MPRLSQFIQEHSNDILAEWETFARKLPSTASMDVDALRDHAEAMLEVIALDIETSQTEQQRTEKARGALKPAGDVDLTAASRHGLDRAESGFSLENTLAELRALRASVISLWRERLGQAGPAELEEMTRFNEAIDQTLAESTVRYMREVEAVRDRFLAVLGHDLRNPIGAVLLSSHFLLETAELNDAQRDVVAGIERSGRRMNELVRDLLDLALTRLGGAIPLKLAEMDMGDLVREVVAEVSASNPESRIEVETSGTLVGAWDRARLDEALSNLVGNAIQHGWRTVPIKVAVRGDEPATVTVTVANAGPPIPHDQIGRIFNAMKGNPNDRDRRHLGLGLYIVDKIVEAHGGRIDIRSSEEEGTIFIVSLPRRSPALSHRAPQRPS